MNGILVKEFASRGPRGGSGVSILPLTDDARRTLREGENVSVGSPFIDGATVTAEVVDQHRAKKVIAFKFKRRKGHHKTKGHRRQLTRLQIKSV